MGWGERLDESLAASGKTRRDLEVSLQLTRNHYNSWLNGGVPHADTFLRLAKFLQVSPYWLMFGDDCAIPESGSSNAVSRP